METAFVVRWNQDLVFHEGEDREMREAVKGQYVPKGNSKVATKYLHEARFYKTLVMAEKYVGADTRFDIVPVTLVAEAPVERNPVGTAPLGPHGTLDETGNVTIRHADGTPATNEDIAGWLAEANAERERFYSLDEAGQRAYLSKITGFPESTFE